MGASNLDAIINEGTLTIGWVGPALLGILIAAFGWAGRVFEWLGTLAPWLFSGEWRGGGEVWLLALTPKGRRDQDTSLYVTWSRLSVQGQDVPHELASRKPKKNPRPLAHHWRP